MLYIPPGGGPGKEEEMVMMPHPPGLKEYNIESCLQKLLPLVQQKEQIREIEGCHYFMSFCNMHDSIVTLGLQGSGHICEKIVNLFLLHITI